MIQFSIWKEPWPEKAFEYLTSVDCKYRWYHLFEPNLLIRVSSEHDEDFLTGVELLAHSKGFFYELGDKAKSSPSGHNGKYFYGEAAFYGEKLNEANQEWLFATSELMRILESEHKRNFRFLRKHLHLFCNQAGMNYWKEGWFLLRSAIQSFRLGIKYGKR